MKMENSITIQALNCIRCGYKWFPRKENAQPIQCPKCKTYEWNKERTKKKKTKLNEPRNMNNENKTIRR